MAAQDQALRINVIKVKIDNQEGDVRCKMCKDREETLVHLASECSKLAQLEYKKKHNKVAGIVHWSLCEKYGLSRSDQWFQHTGEPVIETEKIKILWDVSIQTDPRLNTDDQML